MRKSLSILVALAASSLAASFASGLSGQAVCVLNRSQETVLSPRSGGRNKKRTDRKGWNQNLQRAQSSGKRGGSRPVTRGR